VYLTDIGAAILECIRRNGGWIKLNEGIGYLPKKMTFQCGKLKGIVIYTRLGPSSYHTAIDVYLDGKRSDIESFRQMFLRFLGRDPTVSPFFAYYPQPSSPTPPTPFTTTDKTPRKD